MNYLSLSVYIKKGFFAAFSGTPADRPITESTHNEKKKKNSRSREKPQKLRLLQCMNAQCNVNIISTITIRFSSTGTAHIDELNQSNGRTSSDTSNTTHLHSTPDRSQHICPARPAAYNTGLNISKHKQGNRHNTNTPVQRNCNLLDNEVRNKRNEPANEVTQRERDCRSPRLVAVRSYLSMMESKQELKESVLRRMQVTRDICNRRV